MTIVILKVLIKLWILDHKFYLDFKKKKKKERLKIKEQSIDVLMEDGCGWMCCDNVNGFINCQVLVKKISL